MQTVLGLVIHRFDIHIKRETGCFDVRGSRSQGTAEVAHFFFYWHSTLGGGWWWGWVQWGAYCWGQGVQKDSGWGTAIPLRWLDVTSTTPPPSTHAHFSTHQPPTYARPLRIILKLTPIFIPPPISHQYSIHTSCASVSSSSASCAALFPHTFALPLPPYQKTTHNFLSQKQDEWWRGGRQGV